MKFVRTVLSKLYIAWTLTVFTVSMIIYLPGILIPFAFGTRAGALGFKFLKLWSWTFSKLNFIPYKIHGRENINKNKTYIYVCNHTSYLDIPGISLTIPTQFRPLAKKELKRLPIFGWIAQSACIIVDRSSTESKKSSMDHLKEILKMGISIFIFPEGTQNRSKEALQPFYDGAFRIAIESGQPLLPMVVMNAGKLMPPGKSYIEPGTIEITVGKEIPTNHLDMSGAKALKKQVFNYMTEMIRNPKSK